MFICGPYLTIGSAWNIIVILRGVDILTTQDFDHLLFSPDVTIPFENLDTGR